MKTYEECLDEVAQIGSFENWKDLVSHADQEGIFVSENWYKLAAEKLTDSVKKSYADACIEASLIKAAEELKIGHSPEEWAYLREIVTGPSNHVLL